MKKVKTMLLKVNPKEFFACELKEVVDLLKNGEIVAFPTETVYGLGANAFNKKAVAKIFTAKSRPSDNPMIVHICNEVQLKEVVQNIPLKAKKLIKEFWPGPLTLVLKKSKKVPLNVTAGLDTVAVRMPSHLVALALINETGFPIAAPSANSSGKPSPTMAKHVLEDLNGKIPLVIDSGSCEIGLESTVLSLVNSKPVLLRPGKITVEEIEKVIGKISVLHKDKGVKISNNEKPLSPGMKYKHYAPKAKVILVMPHNDFSQVAKKYRLNSKTWVISFSKNLGFKNEYYFNNNLNKFGAGLFAVFREIDEKNGKLILVEGIEEKGMGLAIMNRLKKAAAKNI